MGSSPSQKKPCVYFKNYFSSSFWWNNYLDETIYLKIYSRRTDYLQVACHHFIVCAGIEENFRVAEWVNCETPLHIFTCESFSGKECINLGKLKLKQVKEAIDYATCGKSYSFFRYNCNAWVEKVIRRLGFHMKIKWNCKCF